jgi:hypothetical protein
MALTSAQQVDVRRYMGYSVSGDGTSFPYRELVYSNVSYMGLSIDYRLQHLTADEETVVVNIYLTKLAGLEIAITSAGDNLDTDQAAVWVHNKREVADRTALFDLWRRRLCEFLGFKPGPSLGHAGVRLSRA